MGLGGFEDSDELDLSMLTVDEREWFEERAAIREFDGEMPRAEAERLALADVLAVRKSALL